MSIYSILCNNWYKRYQIITQTLEASQNLLSGRIFIFVVVCTSLSFGGIGLIVFSKYQDELLTETYSPSKSNVDFTIKYPHLWTNVDFTIKYPHLWVAEIIGPGDAEKVRLYPKNRHTKDNCPLELSVNVANLGESPRLEEYKERIKQKIIRYNSNTLDNSNEQSLLSNYEAYQISYFHRENTSCKLKILERGILLNQKAYYVIYKSPSKEYDRYWWLIAKMIDSFKIK